ncbi:2898_t:CDS:1, partial [Dentiscutata heterogama]
MPVMVSLMKRRPDIYQSEICIICNKKKEILEHVLICSSLEPIWKNIEN